MLGNEEWMPFVSWHNFFHRREGGLLSLKAVTDAVAGGQTFSVAFPQSLLNERWLSRSFLSLPVLRMTLCGGNVSSRKLTRLHRCRVALAVSVKAQSYVGIMDLVWKPSDAWGSWPHRGNVCLPGDKVPVGHTQRLETEWKRGLVNDSHLTLFPLIKN